MPDGLLQNVTSSHIRFWIRSQAKVLGVVSIPQEAFVPYGTGIKTSLLLLQKLPSSSRAACFMARVQKIGYDVKGQPVYQRDASGRTMRTPSGLPMVDDDIEEIAAVFGSFRAGTFDGKSEKVYSVSEELLNSRLDAEHYQPEDQMLIEHLKSVGAKPLSEIAEILTETDDFLRQVRRLMTGHAIPAISIEDLSKVLVPIPSKEEQERIANAIAQIQSMRKQSLRAGEKVVIETDA